MLNKSMASVKYEFVMVWQRSDMLYELLKFKPSTFFPLA